MYRASLQQKKIAAATSESEKVSVWKRLEPRASYGTREPNVLVTRDENVERGNREIELFSPRAPVPSVLGRMPPLGTSENICNQPVPSVFGQMPPLALLQLCLKRPQITRQLLTFIQSIGSGVVDQGVKGLVFGHLQPGIHKVVKLLLPFHRTS